MKSRPVLFAAAVLLLATHAPSVVASGQSLMRLKPGVVELATQAQLQTLGRSLPSEAIDAAGARAAIERATSSGQLDLGAMPVEDAIVLMLQLIARDADADLRAQMAAINASNQEKKAQREPAPATPRPPVAGRVMMAPSRTRIAAPAMVLDTPNKESSKDALSESGEAMQLQMQAYADRRAKAMETLSNLMKKTSETSSQIIDNMK